MVCPVRAPLTRVAHPNILEWLIGLSDRVDGQVSQPLQVGFYRRVVVVTLHWGVLGKGHRT